MNNRSGAQSPLQNNYTVPPAAQIQALAPLDQSMDEKVSLSDLEYDRYQFGRTAVANVRLCGEGVCYNSNPRHLPSVLCESLESLFKCCMLPTNCISQPCYWASKHRDKVNPIVYASLDLLSGVVLCPIAIANAACSSTLVAFSAPCMYVFSGCEFLSPALDFNKDIDTAIKARHLALLVELTEKKSDRDLILSDHCLFIMRLTAEEFDQAITMKQRIQLYAHMADRFRFREDKMIPRISTSNHKIGSSDLFLPKLQHFLAVLLSAKAPSVKQLAMLDWVLQIEGVENHAIGEDFWKDLAGAINELLWKKFSDADQKKSHPQWKPSFFEKNTADIDYLYKILHVLEKFDLLLDKNLQDGLKKLKDRGEMIGKAGLLNSSHTLFSEFKRDDTFNVPAIEHKQDFENESALRSPQKK